QVFQQISATLAQVAQNVLPPAGSAPLSSISPSISTQSGLTQQPGMSTITTTQVTPSAFQQLLFSILRQFSDQMANGLISRLTNSNQQLQGNNMTTLVPPYGSQAPITPSTIVSAGNTG